MRDMAADIFGREKRGEREGYRKGAGGELDGGERGAGQQTGGWAGGALG